MMFLLDLMGLQQPTMAQHQFTHINLLKLENVTTVNPLYGLTGYSVIQTAGAATIVKSPNTSNYVEFRFSVDLSSGNNS